MKNTRNIATKCLLLMKAQAALSGVNLDQHQLAYSPKRLDSPEFIDLLTKKSPQTNNIKNLKDREYSQFTQSVYESPLNHSESNVYKINEDGTTTQIFNNNKQSIRDYLTQKLVAIQALKNQISAREETKQFFNPN